MKYVQFGNLTIVPFAENLEVSISYEFLFKLGFFFKKKKVIFWEKEVICSRKVMGFRLGFPFQSPLITV